MIRAADSIGANIAESYARRSHRDRLRMLWVARGSVSEVQHWIAAAQERGLKLPDQSHQTADRMGRMLNGLARTRRNG
jgi:four helix bundle protein